MSMREPSKGVGVANWLVSKTSGFLDARLTRRSFVSRATLVGTAVAATGCAVITQPGAPYTRIADCPGNTLCHDGYTEFCCVINKGVNACPPNTISAGWWRADYSVFCNGTRYYIDCNEVCCGPVRGDGFCAGCHACECAAGCNTRKVHCSYFRYGQCHQLLAHVGPIACRMVTCVPPYQLNIGCSASGAVDNSTAGHFADCSKYAPPRPVAPPMGSIAPGLGGAALPAAGMPVVFAKHEDDKVWYRQLNGAAWTAWATIGGVATSGGAAVSPSAGQILTFVRGADLAIWYQRFNGSSWSGFSSLGGAPGFSDPAAVRHAGATHLFARLSDFKFWWRLYDGAAWTTWQPLLGFASSTPAPISIGSSLWLFGRLKGNDLWFRRYQGGAWGAATNLGGALTSDPGVGVLGANPVVFGRDADHALQFRRFDGTAWTAWTSLGGPITSDPVCATLGASLYVFARLERGELWYRRTSDGVTWDPWTAVSAPLVMSDPTVIVDGTMLHVFASWSKTRLGHTSFNGTAWTGWDDLGGSLALVRGS